MAKPKPAIELSRALNIARQIEADLVAACDRITIAGSIRRGARIVGDIEIVAIPRVGAAGASATLYSEPVCLLHHELDERVRAGRIEAVSGHGPQNKARRYRLSRVSPPIGLDVFTARPETWGYVLALRTGPARYSKRLVTQRCRGGLLDDRFRCRDGAVWISEDVLGLAIGAGPPDASIDYDAQPRVVDEPEGDMEPAAWRMHPVPKEADFFKLIRGGYVEPEGRRA